MIVFIKKSNLNEKSHFGFDFFLYLYKKIERGGPISTLKSSPLILFFEKKNNI